MSQDSRSGSGFSERAQSTKLSADRWRQTGVRVNRSGIYDEWVDGRCDSGKNTSGVPKGKRRRHSETGNADHERPKSND
jgi:hypothetical protein